VDLATTSRIFIDVASRLALLHHAKRVERVTLTVSELERLSAEKSKEGLCLMFKPHTVGGYILACDGKVVAIAIREPPRVGNKALEAVDDNPLPGDLYVVSKEAFVDALNKMFAGKRVVEKAAQVLSALNEIAQKVLEARLEKETSVEELAQGFDVKELEIFDLIDTVTLTDEIAYYLDKMGYTVETSTPEELGGHYVVVIKVHDDVPLEKLIKDLMEVAEKCDAKSLIKLIDSKGNEYYFDPTFFKSITKLLSRLPIELRYMYIKAVSPEEAEFNLVFSSDVTTISMGKFIGLLEKLIKKRRLPWKKVKVVIYTPTNIYRSPD